MGVHDSATPLGRPVRPLPPVAPAFSRAACGACSLSLPGRGQGEGESRPCLRALLRKVYRPHLCGGQFPSPWDLSLYGQRHGGVSPVLSLPVAPKRQIPVPWHGRSVVHAVIGRVPVHFRGKSLFTITMTVTITFTVRTGRAAHPNPLPTGERGSDLPLPFRERAGVRVRTVAPPSRRLRDRSRGRLRLNSRQDAGATERASASGVGRWAGGSRRTRTCRARCGGCCRRTGRCPTSCVRGRRAGGA